MDKELPERSRRKRGAILEAATELFLEKGYAGTSMDEVAAAASVSKQTIYKHFGDKQALFEQIVMGTVTGVSQPFQALIRAVEEADDVPRALGDLARRYLSAVMAPDVLRRRRLVVREAGRLPELARAYHDGSAGATIRHLSQTFARLTDRGELTVEDPEVAATHFAFLILGRPLDAAMFHEDGRPSPHELAATADAATDAFLAAYRPVPGDAARKRR